MIKGESGLAHLDRELERRVVIYLSQLHFPGLSTLNVEADCGVVTLRGQVKSFHEWQQCIHGCQRVAGVLRLNDKVEVE